MKDNAKEVQQLKELIQGSQSKVVKPQAVATPKHKADIPPQEPQQPEEQRPLTVLHEQKMLYKGRICNYYILGYLPQDFSMLPVTLSVTEDTTNKRGRYKFDLFDRSQCRQNAMDIANLFYTDEGAILRELTELTDALEQYRDSQVELQQAQKKQAPPMFPVGEKIAMEFLSAYDLMNRTDQLLEQAGIQQGGQRLLLYIIGASYKNAVPLHIGILGDNNSVKSLINSIGQCLPAKDLFLLTNVTGKSLYHCTNNELKDKILLLPNGVDKKAGQPLKQLQQGEVIATATTVKDRNGNMRSMVERVESHFSSIMFIQPNEQYSHIICASIEPQSQTDRSIKYYNKKVAGLVDEKAEQRAMELLQNAVRCLKPMQVVNPNADRITLPVHSDVKERMNVLYQSLVQQVCLFHQYQRKKDTEGRLVAQTEDMRIAANMLFGAMVLDNDELEPAVRKFYEQVKTYVLKKAGDKANTYKFTLRELRRELGISKNYCFRYMTELQKLEYVLRIGYANRGFKYQVAYFDDVSKERERIKSDLDKQFEKLRAYKSKTVNRPPEALMAKALDGSVLKLPRYSLSEPVRKYKKKK